MTRKPRVGLVVLSPPPPRTVDKERNPSGWYRVKLDRRTHTYTAILHHGDEYEEHPGFASRREANVATWDMQFWRVWSALYADGKVHAAPGYGVYLVVLESWERKLVNYSTDAQVRRHILRKVGGGK